MASVFYTTLLFLMVVPPIISLEFLFRRYAIIGYSLKTCFSLLLLISSQLKFSLRIFLMFVKVWLYIMIKGIWVGFSLFFTCCFRWLRRLNWSCIVFCWLARCFVKMYVSLVLIQMLEIRRACDYGILFFKDADELIWNLSSLIGSIGCEKRLTKDDR